MKSAAKSPTAEGSLTILPVESIFTRQLRRILCADDPRVERLESDIRARVLLGEMLDNLIASSFAWAIADVAWLDYLAGRRRDIDNDPWTGRL